MDPQFFNLRKQWIAALVAAVFVFSGSLFQHTMPSLQIGLLLLGCAVLFVQFVWSGAYAIAALLTGKTNYFFSLLLLSVFEIAAMSIGIVLYISASESGADKLHTLVK